MPGEVGGPEVRSHCSVSRLVSTSLAEEALGSHKPHRQGKAWAMEPDGGSHGRVSRKGLAHFCSMTVESAALTR